MLGCSQPSSTGSPRMRQPRATLNDLLENVPKMREAATRLAPLLHAAKGVPPG